MTKTTIMPVSMALLSTALILLLCVQGSLGFQAAFASSKYHTVDTRLHMAIQIGKNYKPKWKKKETLADQEDGFITNDLEKGLVGTVSVVFKQGDVTKNTMAIPGQPISDVATQAGQFIKYGCGKGECGTCEAMCNGKWIRPCQATVPADLSPGQDLVIQVKKVNNKAKSSGKFYSFRSIFMGFWNNLLGMLGMLITRKAAKKNYTERIDFEDMVAKLTAEKKALKLKEVGP
uniref:2Fe-2S ferredoxin-type domain-containing protein n=1 Tax=Eucampia antarctica TaxID=49252 RepID=A0A7S2WPK8_9STRA|mmetsp:Transcript_8362/g.7913  ORF Transcript_8362/g.7913 Transcript_8362/m.7913 type:complete len:232 (+) Transcript_8362:44-739(+)